MQIVPFDANLGADVTEISLADIDDSDFNLIYDAWLQHSVLRIRDQHLDDNQLKDFSKRFGPLEYAPHGNVTEEERSKIPNPYVATISNVTVNGRPIGGLSNLETSWHTDMSYIEDPPTASLLYAVEVPGDGGETSFCSMTAALEQLPDDLRQLCTSIRIKHDAAHDSIGKIRNGHTEFSSPKDAPGVYHPAIRRHPETHKDALYLGRRQNAYVEGMSLSNSEATLDSIWEHVALPAHCWTQQWRVNDLVIWDNRIVMHQRAAFPNSQRRLMRRTQVKPRN